MPESQSKPLQDLKESVPWWGTRTHPKVFSILKSLIGGSSASTEVIENESDLPNPSGGVIQLADSTAYSFDGFVTSQYPLQLVSLLESSS